MPLDGSADCGTKVIVAVVVVPATVDPRVNVIDVGMVVEKAKSVARDGEIGRPVSPELRLVLKEMVTIATMSTNVLMVKQIVIQMRYVII